MIAVVIVIIALIGLFDYAALVCASKADDDMEQVFSEDKSCSGLLEE